jgi:hypothetical protein
MGAALANLIAALTTIYGLSVVTTRVDKVDSLLSLLTNLFTGQGGRIITADEAASGLFYAVLLYLITYSVMFFVFRAIGFIGLALGVPDEQSIRSGRQESRIARFQADATRRQAKLIARYINRAQVPNVPPMSVRGPNAITPAPSFDDEGVG